MDIVLRDYQADCLEKVITKIDDGAKHISVVMSTGLGQRTVSFFLAKRLRVDAKTKIAIVFGLKAALEQMRAETEKIGCEALDYFILDDFLGREDEYQYIILHDISTFDRKRIQDKLLGKENITISFSSPWKDLEEKTGVKQKIHLLSYFERINPVMCVYVTNEVLDIRDAKYAGKSEIQYISQKNLDTSNWLQQEKEIIINEREEVKRRNDRLLDYVNVIKQAKDQKKIAEMEAEIESLKALLQADERDKKIEELEAKEKEYQKQLMEKDIQLIQQEQMIAFQQDILNGFGIEPELIKESFEQIQKAREELKEDLESDIESVSEIALKKLQDKVAEIVSGLTQKTLSEGDQNYFEEYLISELTLDVWNKLDDKSKAFLITAKSNFESMIKMKDSESFDYSGVCLLVTKALEVETTKRFFLYYKDYLSQKYKSVSSWPYVLRQKNRGQITDSVIADNEFTLGSVVSVVGYKRDYGSNGTIIEYTIQHTGTKNEFLNYAQQVLFKTSDRHKAETELEKDYKFIEKVRLDYRNPSAHRDRLTITSAKGCLDYVIDVQHMLKEMLSVMKI